MRLSRSPASTVIFVEVLVGFVVILHTEDAYARGYSKRQLMQAESDINLNVRMYGGSKNPASWKKAGLV